MEINFKKVAQCSFIDRYTSVRERKESMRDKDSLKGFALNKTGPKAFSFKLMSLFIWLPASLPGNY